MALLQLSHLSGAVVATFSGLLLPRLRALSRRSTERAGGRRAGARVDELGLLGQRVLWDISRFFVERHFILIVIF